MFKIFKKVENKDNTPKQDHNLSYDNIAIPAIHKGQSDDEDVEVVSFDTLPSKLDLSILPI